MSRERLLERLLQAEMPSDHGAAFERLKRSVLLHLTGLLNSRQGSVPSDSLYGIPDLCNVAGSFAMGTSESIIASVLSAITRYEPRLVSPVMRSSEEKKEVISLLYIISGTLFINDNQSEPFSFYLRINSAGRIFLEEFHGI